MSVTLQFTVEDVATQLLTYASLRVYRASSQYATYSQITDITLVADTYTYTYADDNGDLNKWYQYSYYNATGPVESSKSAPFRPDGTTLQRIRQRAMEEFGVGMVFTASAGDGTTVTTTDFRLKSSSGLSTSRGKGTWLYRPDEDDPANARMIISYVPSTGIFTVGGSWGVNPGSGNEIEWHWLADPLVWNNAIERACGRYWYLDRIPIPGVKDQEEYDLSSIAPWLTRKRQVHDLRYYPGRVDGADDGIDRSWGAGGRWWGVKIDRHVLTLQIAPTVDSNTVFYLEASRTAAPLYAEAASPPLACSEELLAALAYDEVLAFLSHPDVGSAQDRTRWATERVIHNRTHLARLIKLNRLEPSLSPPRLSSPPAAPAPWHAR